MITLMQLSAYTGDIAAPSPNHDGRKAPAIEGIVLHATADQGEEDLSLSWMRSPKSRVSCHLLVSRDGRVTRLVGDRERAWHAGASWWRGTNDVNSITLGIEIANRNDGERYSDAQYQRVAEIVAHYCGQGLSLDDVVSHEEICEGRKTDPFGWEWQRFRSIVKSQLSSTLAPRRPDPTEVAEMRRGEMKPPRMAPTPRMVAAAKELDPAPKGRKSIFRSRTLWLNALTVVAAGGLLVNDTLDLAHKIGLHLPEAVTKWALFILGLLNIILRLRTSRPLVGSHS